MLIFLFLSNFVFANDQVIEELTRKRDELQKSIVEIKKNKIKYAKAMSDKVNRKDVLSSAQFLASIAKGVILVEIDTEKTFYLTRDITVIAHEKVDEDGYRWIVGDNEKVKYKAHFQEVVNIELVTNMYEAPKFFKPLKKKNKVVSYDQILNFESEFLFHLGMGSANYTKDLIDAHTSSYSQIYRYELNSIAKWNFPVYFGLSLARESFFMQNKDDKANGVFYSVGPLIKSPEFRIAKAQSRFYGNYRYGLNSSMNTLRDGEQETYRFHLNSMNLGIEFLNKNSIGAISFGANFQRQWLKPVKNQESLELGARSQYDDSVTLFIGQSWDYSWL